MDVSEVKLENHINCIPKKALNNPILYQNHNSVFDELSAKKTSPGTYDHNLQKLLIEIKVEMNMATKVMK